MCKKYTANAVVAIFFSIIGITNAHAWFQFKNNGMDAHYPKWHRSAKVVAQ